MSSKVALSPVVGRPPARCVSSPAFGRGVRGLSCVGLLSLAACLGSCKSEPDPVPAEAAPEAVAEKKPVLDEKIANAMAAAQANAQVADPSAAGQLAPPADGIMGVEAAARELAPGAPAQLVLGAEGASPRLRLGAERLPLGAGPAGKLELSYRSGGSVMPTIQFDLKSKVSAVANAAVVPAVAVEGGSSGEIASAGALSTRFSLANARPADNQPGRLPDNARAEIAKLNGSWVELVTTPRGALLRERSELAGSNADLRPLVSGSAETLASIMLPYPEVPVGVGAFWMVKSRETVGGAEVLAFRMVRLTELAPDKAQLTVNTRRYLVHPTLPLEGLPPHRVRQFESEGDATLSLVPGAPYPQVADLRDSFVALVTPSDRPNQALPVQSELSAKLSFGAAGK
jgi:hypothetical protein